MGFPHRAGRYRPGGLLFSPPGCWSCTCTEGLLTRTLPRRGENSTLFPRPTLAARGLCEPQQLSHQWMGVGFPHGVSTPCGAVSTRGITVFVPVWLVLYTLKSILDSGMETYLPRVRQDLDVGPSGDSRSALALQAPANQQSVHGCGVSTPCRAVSTRGSLFSSRDYWTCLCMEGLMNREMGPYPPRVRRDLDFGPRGNYRSALAL